MMLSERQIGIVKMQRDAVREEIEACNLRRAMELYRLLSPLWDELDLPFVSDSVRDRIRECARSRIEINESLSCTYRKNSGGHKLCTKEIAEMQAILDELGTR